jgi:hypothetical protein
MYIVLALQCQKNPKQLINCLKREKQTSFLLFLMVPSVKSVLILLLFVNMNLVPENLYLDQWLYIEKFIQSMQFDCSNELVECVLEGLGVNGV